jgi:hypothetical protein
MVDADVATGPAPADLDFDHPSGVGGEHAVSGLALQVQRLVHPGLDEADRPALVVGLLVVGRGERRLLEAGAGRAVAEAGDVAARGAEEAVLGPQDQRRQQRRHQQQRLRLEDRLERHGHLTLVGLERRGSLSRRPAGGAARARRRR